jgi:hypothetical protein
MKRYVLSKFEICLLLGACAGCQTLEASGITWPHAHAKGTVSVSSDGDPAVYLEPGGKVVFNVDPDADADTTISIQPPSVGPDTFSCSPAGRSVTCTIHHGNTNQNTLTRRYIFQVTQSKKGLVSTTKPITAYVKDCKPICTL